MKYALVIPDGAADEPQQDAGGLTVTQPRRASPGWRFGWQLAASAMLRRDAPNCRRSARFLRQLLRFALRLPEKVRYPRGFRTLRRDLRSRIP